MKFRLRHSILALLLGFGCPLPAAADPPTYNADIRRLLASNCFACHGQDPETRAADLRLDVSEAAVSAGAIVPGDAEASPLMARLLAHDPADRMPPPESNRVLAPEEIDLIRRWIDAGAVYEPHWAFVAPKKPAPPAVSNPLWPRNGLDHFVLARLDAEGLAPAPEADPHTLARRAALDLTGLPPGPALLEAFVNDKSPVAYETYVRKLLESPHYGERWARIWLDLARYADTKGYEADRGRIVWRFRDWVIDAYNADTPYDQFTIEQLAGDLLPDPTVDQLIATAFHRNTMTNDEGGTDNEEFRSAAVVDRVNTTMDAWMGLTMACAQCHTHKYDPITQTEYFQFYAFFNQTADADLFPVETPVIATPTAEQQRALAVLDERSAFARARRDAAAQTLAPNRSGWEAALLRGQAAPILGPWSVSPAFPAEGYPAAFDTAFAPESDPAAVAWTPKPEWTDGEIHPLEGDVAATYLRRTVTVAEAASITLRLGSNDGLRLWVNGAEILAHREPRTAEADQNEVTAPLQAGDNDLVLKVVNSGGQYAFYFKADAETVPENVVSAAALAPGERTPEQAAALDAYWHKTAPELAPYREELAALDAERARLDAEIPTTPILQELPPDERRETHVHIRGSFLSPGDRVEPGVPAVFPAMKPEMPPNRLGLAQWLVDRDNPLTARVAVNRYWEALFGTGIVETSEDFGTQGALPTHPELLDWLAVEFMDRGWSMKELCYLIVTSATYRQASAVTPELVERDPYNRLFARGPRIRLEAEAIRDQALAVAGLLDRTLRGPSVMPYQPDGVWQVVYNQDQWTTSEGGDRHRRGLYTYWRRSSPYPSMVAFDAPSREICTVRRIPTNTPLQAFVTLNDPVYVEAAQALARRIVDTPAASPEERAAHGLRLALARPADDAEAQTLAKLYRAEYDHYRTKSDDARALAEKPLGPIPPGADPAEYAAWTVVANVLLNMDETLTKR